MRRNSEARRKGEGREGDNTSQNVQTREPQMEMQSDAIRGLSERRLHTSLIPAKDQRLNC